MNTSMPPHIGIVEDDEDFRENVEFFLRARGLIVWSAGSAEAFCRQLPVTQTDIALIDLGLPGGDGLALIRQLQAGPPRGIIVLTARGDMECRLEAMHDGADHYLVKPIDLRELYVTIEAIWRRIQAGQLPTQASAEQLTAVEPGERWHYDPIERTLAQGDRPALKLSSAENLLMALLTSRPNEVIGKQQILDLVYSGEKVGDFHRIEVLLNRLRQKAHAADLLLPVRSVFGKGLVFAADCSRADSSKALRWLRNPAA